MIATCVTLLSTMLLAQAAGQPPKEAPVAAAQAHVIFVHASVDAPAVDVYVNGKKEITGLAFGKPSEVKAFAAGEAKIELKAGDKVVLTAPAKLAADKHYTVAAIGKADALKAQVLECKAVAGKAHVIVFHASPDAGVVDVNVDGKTASKALDMGKSFEATLDAGKHKVELMAGDKAALTKELELKADTCYCVLATGMAKGDAKAPKLDLTVAAHAMAAAKAPAPAPAPAPAAKDKAPAPAPAPAAKDKEPAKDKAPAPAPAKDKEPAPATPKK